MDNKHYNAAYLEDTEKLLLGLKKSSYEYLSGLSAGKILELGCGTGSDAIQLAQQFGEAIQVIGLDHDPELLVLGREAAKKSGLKHLEFVEGLAEDLPFPANSLDGIRAERLVQHLQQPKKVLEEVHRTLKPGGKVVLVETDWSGLNIYNSELEIERNLVDYLTHKRVNFGTASREIGLLLDGLGFRNIQWVVKPFVIHRLDAANKYIMFDKMLMSATDEGFLSQEECTKYLTLCKRLDEKGLFACSMSMVTYLAEK